MRVAELDDDDDFVVKTDHLSLNGTGKGKGKGKARAASPNGADASQFGNAADGDEDMYA